MKKLHRLCFVVLIALLAQGVPALALAPAGEYLGYEDQVVDSFLVKTGPETLSWVQAVERAHSYRVLLADGSYETLVRFQYLYFDEQSGEPLAESKIFSKRLDAGAVAKATPEEEPKPVPEDENQSDPVQDVIDELEGYKTTLQRMKARSSGLRKVKICSAIDDIDVAITGLGNLPGGEGEIEAALDWAIMSICGLNPEPNSSLERMKNALINLRMHLF